MTSCLTGANGYIGQTVSIALRNAVLQAQSWVHVADLADSYVRAVKHSHSLQGEAFNIVSYSAPTTIRLIIYSLAFQITFPRIQKHSRTTSCLRQTQVPFRFSLCLFVVLMYVSSRYGIRHLADLLWSLPSATRIISRMEPVPDTHYRLPLECTGATSRFQHLRTPVRRKQMGAETFM